MVEHELFEYRLNSNEKEQSLKLSIKGNKIYMVIENKAGNKESYSALVTYSQLKQVCKAFLLTKNIKEAIIILNNTIESGNIILTQDELGSSIDLKFYVKSGSKKYPPFAVNLALKNKNQFKGKTFGNNIEVLPVQFDYGGNFEAQLKYGKIPKNTTEYAKPIVDKDFKQPILSLEYVEPILQVHYPDGTTKTTPLSPKIKTIDGKLPDIDEEQFKYIREQMNKNISNQSNYQFQYQNMDNQRSNPTNYSFQTMPIKYNNNNFIQNSVNYNNYNYNQIINGNFNGDLMKKSLYSTYTAPNKSAMFLGKEYINSNYNYFKNNNNIPNYYNLNNNQISTLPQEMEQDFAEVIPLGTKEELQGQILPQEIGIKDEENNMIEQNEYNENNEENQIEQHNYEIQPQNKEIEENEDYEQTPEEDFETLYRTEEGLIIFRNGILKGIVHKYAEISKVVDKIQKKLLKGAKFHLLYKATLHGDKSSEFHEKCDNHQMTLVLIETDKGVRFGGFTTKTWDGHCVKKIDNDAFVFSIDNNEIFDIIRNEPAIGCYPKFGPVFFGCQIRIYNNFFTEGGSTCYQGLNYKTKKDFELNNGEQTYIVKDIEVYDIESIDINIDSFV